MPPVSECSVALCFPANLGPSSSELKPAPRDSSHPATSAPGRASSPSPLSAIPRPRTSVPAAPTCGIDWPPVPNF